VSLASFTNHLERLERDEESNQATKETQITLSQVTKHFWSLDLIMELGEDQRLWMCLWSVFFALVLKVESGRLGWLEWWWLGVFIALTNILAVGWLLYRWAHRTQYYSLSVVCHISWSLKLSVFLVHRTVRWHTGQSSVTWRHRLSSDLWRSNCCAVNGSRPLAKSTVALWAHWTDWWFLAEECFDFPRAASSWSAPAWAPDTV
jgi:hypothetical protein